MSRASLAISRPLVAVIIIAVIAVGAVSVLYLPRILNPTKIKVVNVVIPPYSISRGATFDPENITVAIGINNTVVWTNNEGVIVTVTEGKPVFASLGLTSCTQRTVTQSSPTSPAFCPSSTPLFDSGDVKSGGTFTYTFRTPGVYEYFNVYEFQGPQKGFVTVEQ